MTRCPAPAHSQQSVIPTPQILGTQPVVACIAVREFLPFAIFGGEELLKYSPLSVRPHTCQAFLRNRVDPMLARPHHTEERQSPAETLTTQPVPVQLLL